MSRLLRRYIFLLLTVFFPISAFSQSLIMNEVSNGPTGNQEYVEFVVVSNSVTYDCTSPTPPCIDIRGWIFDDNSGYHGTDGIATGAVRFSQDPIWSCVPLGTIILIYNGADRNPAIPPDDISMADNNCTIIAPINSTTLFESNTTTPGAVACSYPATGWTAGGNWNNTVLANPADCARIVNLAGCEVFSLCYGTDNLNNLIYFPGTGGQTCWYFNDVDPMNQANWSQGSASPSPGDQTPGLPNNAANAAYIGSFNNNCQPITPINVTASSTPSGCTCNGTATATATGSIGGYTYVWYDAAFNPIGQNTATATGLCPGTYVVIATSHIGCPDTTYTTVASSGSVTQSINTATICNGASATLTATPSINGGTFSWSPGGATTQSITVSPSSTTVYSCTYTYTGCTTTATSTVTVNPVPTLTVNSPTICSGSSATLTANPSIAGGTYAWSGGGGNSATATVSPAATTTYTVDYLLAGCPASAISTVTVNPLPVASLNAATICSGASATLTATVAPAGGTYSWSPGGQTTGTISVSPAATTTYSVTYTSAGCTSTASNTVTVNPLPTVSVNSSTICAGSAATLTASVSPAGGTYAWSPGGQTTGSISVSPSSTTTYSVTYTNAGCTSTATNSVTVNPLPALSINSSTICAGGSATLTATPSIAGGTYSWAPGGQSTAGITVSPASTTIYTSTYTVNGCSATSSSTISVNPLPTVSVNSTSVCSGSSATLTATPSLNGGTYSWSPGGQTTNSISVTPVANTNYTVTYDLSGCTATATCAVTVNPLPTVNVNSATICTGSSTTLTGTPSISGGTFTWSPGGQTTSAITISPAITTTYSVTYDLAGCTATSSGTVTVNPLPNVVATSATICNGQNATLNVTGAASYLWGNGNTTSSITISPTTTTTYSVTGTTNGCSATATGTVTVTPLPVVSVNSATICNGQSTTLNASGATSYSWNTGAASTSITVNPATTTTYTVTGTSSGCTSTAASTVTVNPLPIISATSATICQGQSATINATGATSYSWNNGNLTASINVSPAATTVYTVTGTTNGCSSTASGTVSVTALPVISVNSPSICNGLTTTLTATGATTYLWNTGATANSISVTPSSTTTYTVTGIASGCSASSVSTVTVTPAPTVSATSTSICAGQSATITATGANTYSWNTGATTASLTISPASTTIYTVTGSSNGCSSTATGTITVNPIPVVSVNSPSICPGSSTTLIASGANTYVWSTGASTSQINVSPATTSTYTVTGTSLGCTSTATSTVTISTVLSVNAGNNVIICPGSSTILQATPANAGSTFTWSPAIGLSNTTISNPTANPVTNTTYTVTIVDANGCSGSGQVTVSIDPALSASTNGTNPLCNGSSDGHTTALPAGGTSPYTYLWNNGQTTSNLSGVIAGNYSVVITDAAGCTSSASLTLTQPPTLNNSISSTVIPLCNGSCDGQATALANGGTGAISYSWNTTVVQTGTTASALCAGGYVCIATDANGCTATTSVLISQPSPVTISPVTAVVNCAGGSTNLSVSAAGGQGPYQYSWSPAIGLSSTTISNPVAGPTVNTTYTVSVSDANGCTGPYSTVTVPASSQMILSASGNTSICPGESAGISAAASLGSGGPYTYTWTPSTGLSNSSIANPIATPTTTTIYTVTASDGCSTPQSSTVTITVYPSPTANLTANVTSGCAPLCVNFQNGSGGGGTYEWTLGQGEGSSTLENPYHCYTNPGSYDVSLTATTPNGCSGSITYPGMIHVFSLPTANFNSTPDPATVLEPEITFLNLSSSDVTEWLWDFGDGSTSNQSNPSHTYPAIENTEYEVTLIVHNSHGCEDTIQSHVEISPEFTFFIPNSFTPNGDGVNDTFNGKGIGISKYYLGIYDRWGNKIWETDKAGIDWDGRANGGKLIVQEDTYVWRVVLTDVFNKEHRYIGKVTVVK